MNKTNRSTQSCLLLFCISNISIGDEEHGRVFGKGDGPDARATEYMLMLAILKKDTSPNSQAQVLKGMRNKNILILFFIYLHSPNLILWGVKIEIFTLVV